MHKKTVKRIFINDSMPDAHLGSSGMDADRATREEKKKDLLRQLAELSVEEQVEAGLFLGTPRYSII